MTASHISYSWWSHDIGGHMLGIMTSHNRWLQFGVFSPITRLHSSKRSPFGKEPWFQATSKIMERIPSFETSDDSLSIYHECTDT